jgi:putative endonuclease
MYYVYILTNWSNNVLYVGITNNLKRRCYEHRHKIIKGFTEKYNLYKLVHFDTTNDIKEAIKREKQLKGWTRSKKIELIENKNPMWLDLSVGLEG